MRVALGLTLLLVGLAGCGGSGGNGGDVKEFEVHIGWTADGKTQYMTPSEIRVKQGDRVRLVITNDDDPNKDYNGASAGKDNFHDVALRGYDIDGDGDLDTLEHEVIGGRTVTTCRTNQNPCPEGNDFFTATTKGTFRLICEVGDPGGGQPTRHEALGMWTPFVVE